MFSACKLSHFGPSGPVSEERDAAPFLGRASHVEPDFSVLPAVMTKRPPTAHDNRVPSRRFPVQPGIIFGRLFDGTQSTGH